MAFVALVMGLALAITASASICRSLATVPSTGFLCKECLDIARDAQDFVANPDNLKAAIKFVDNHGCVKLPAGYEVKCKAMSEEYVSVLFTTLQDYLTPQKMCMDSGICSAASVRGESSATSCSACLVVATKASGAVEGMHTKLGAACSSRKWMQDKCMAMLNRLGPQLLGAPAHFCMASGMCTMNGARRRNNCALCRYLALEMKKKLQDPKVQEQLIELLLDNCQKLHNHEDECKLLVLEYAPQVFANLEAILDDDDVCAKIGMCGSTMGLSSAI